MKFRKWDIQDSDKPVSQVDYVRLHAGYEFHVFTRQTDKSITQRFPPSPPTSLGLA